MTELIYYLSGILKVKIEEPLTDLSGFEKVFTIRI